LLENALNDLLKRAREINENCRYFRRRFSGAGKAGWREANASDRMANERNAITASG
jgi:hypothetical protein